MRVRIKYEEIEKMKVFRRKLVSGVLGSYAKDYKFMRVTVEAGEASSGAPLGPLLGQVQVPLLEFCNSFNDKTCEVYNDPVDLGIRLFKTGSNYSYQILYPTVNFFFYQFYQKYELDLEEYIYDFYVMSVVDLWFLILVMSSVRISSFGKIAKILFGYLKSSSIQIY